MSEHTRVMISSTVRDLPAHRQKVMDACMDLEVFYPDMMEHLTATDANALEISLRIADRADLYVGIYGFRYGYVPDGQTISVTEAEYNRAVERGIPRLIFLMSDKHPVVPADVETGDGAKKLTEFRERLKKDRVVGFFESADDLKAKVIQALVPYIEPPQAEGAPKTLVHTLPTQLEIEGREAECAAILRAMSEGKRRVYAFAAPGGFGKTALLAKVVQILSPDGMSLLEKVALPNSETVEMWMNALLHIDCRNDVKLSELFAKAGRLIGEQKQFEEIYNSDAALSDKLQEIFSRLSPNGKDKAWFVFDNFESMLNDSSEIADPQLREFFSSVFSGGHNVRSLIVGRDVPKFSRREQAEELEAVGGSLFEGLPVDDCVSFLKKNGAARGLKGSVEQVDTVLKEFSERVHRIPLALVWAVGYLDETSFTLKEVLERSDLFAAFDQEQAKEATRYENKGLKRLHFEQLKIQPSESLPLLSLLAFFKHAVPKGALAHLLHEIELNKTLTRLKRNKLVTLKESPDAYTRYLNDPLATNLYGLHAVICENEFFDSLPGREKLYETAATNCWTRAGAAVGVNRFAYALELYNCAEKFYEHLVKKLNREDLLNNYAGMLMNKGVALRNLTKLADAIDEYDKAIAIRERLVNQEQQTHLVNDLAMAYMNKGNALISLTRLTEAVAEYDRALAIRERLVHQDQQTHLANDLAMTYMNKGTALTNLTKLAEAIVEYEKAIAILERMVHQDQQTHLANDLAMAYMNKGLALANLTRFAEALAELDKTITIRERLVNQEQQTHLANHLAMSYMNKGVVLRNLTRLAEAIPEFDKAIAIRKRLVNQEQQTHLSNELAMDYMNKGNAFADLSKLHEAIAEYDKAIAIRERLVSQEQQTHLANDLAMTYMNKGTALTNLTKLAEAIVEYDKAIAILERLVNHEQQTYLANALAMAYMNKGVALTNLTKWAEAIVEYDKAISIRERLVNQEQQTHLANALAIAYLNKAVAIVRQSDFDEALACYEKSVQGQTFCIEHLKMFWIVPKLLETLRYRLVTLLDLQRWPPAAQDITRFRALLTSYIERKDIDEGLKEAASNEHAQMISSLQNLDPEQRDLLYAELGDEAEPIRSLIDEADSSS